jgi:hypothetical protein
MGSDERLRPRNSPFTEIDGPRVEPAEARSLARGGSVVIRRTRRKTDLRQAPRVGRARIVRRLVSAIAGGVLRQLGHANPAAPPRAAPRRPRPHCQQPVTCTQRRAGMQLGRREGARPCTGYEVASQTTPHMPTATNATVCRTSASAGPPLFTPRIIWTKKTPLPRMHANPR